MVKREKTKSYYYKQSCILAKISNDTFRTKFIHETPLLARTFLEITSVMTKYSPFTQKDFALYPFTEALTWLRLDSKK